MVMAEKQSRTLLQNIAHKVMLERGLLPDFSPAVIAELERLKEPVRVDGAEIRDMSALLWVSIDNDDSADLDQLTVAEALPGEKVKLLVAVADVDALIKNGSAIDEHAHHNTTSVYTAAAIFPMLPEQLSTNLTSLNPDQNRLAIVVELVVASDGSLQDADIYPARVHNYAKLAYNSVAAWLEGKGPIPQAAAKVKGLDALLRLQDLVAQKMKNFRHVHGALSLETVEAKPVFDGDKLSGLEVETKNRAREIIEDFMIAANSATARYLASKNFPSIRRVVRVPERWDRIFELAREHGFRLPVSPDSKALEEFLVKEKAADPLRFPDLSLAVIKLLGRGEYVAELPGEISPGHFGLAVADYAHSTAPNRRYIDLATQRILKAALAGGSLPYSQDELKALAKYCTDTEDVANKVERQVNKSAAAMLLQTRIGEQFDAIVTGAAPKGTWVRLINPPVEGKLVQGYEGVDVGNRIRVQLVGVNVELGYIDFRKIRG
jgi:exoribonuclease-2